MSSTPAIGIDLGTTNSCVAYFKNENEVIVLQNNCGNNTTPSYVAYSKNKVLVGDSAKKQACLNPENTIYDTKRLIGRNFDDPEVENNYRNWPFKIKNVKNRPMIEVTSSGKKEELPAEQIMAVILSALKRTAEHKLNIPDIVDVVITVPAAFNDQQRKATIDAGGIAGLNVLRIINEPTAAALAYSIERKIGNGKHILVYDLGGGTFDVSILLIDDENYRVKSSLGDLHLGGQDFDARLLDALVKEMIEDEGKDPSKNAKAMTRLRQACQIAKQDLSAMTTTTINIDTLLPDFDYEHTITRKYFENLCDDLFKKSIDIVKECIKQAKLIPSQIDEVVLVGGSSRILRVQTLLQEIFPGKPLQFTIHPDHAIALGAAIQAAIVLEDQFAIEMIDIVNTSLGLETVGEKMSILIEKDSPKPCEKTRKYTTCEDYQTEIEIQVFEGEDEKTIKNRSLGKFSLPKIPPKPKGKIIIEVTFAVDDNGILTVTAFETSEGKPKRVKIVEDKGGLSVIELELCTKMNALMSIED